MKWLVGAAVVWAGSAVIVGWGMFKAETAAREQWEEQVVEARANREFWDVIEHSYR